MLTREERERLRALEREATPGEWTGGIWSVGGERDDGRMWEWPSRTGNPFDARLIAAARNALVPLLDHIDALEARLASLADCAQRADPTAQVEPCNGCDEPNDDGCDHCCRTCLGSEMCLSCGVLVKEVEDE